MTHRALVVSHADADGHLIAEQVRRNLASIKGFDVDVVVDPTRTKDHKFWRHLDAIPEIADADLVFFMDMMFGPESFADEAKALVDFAEARPEKRFFLIDHHPLPLRRLGWAKNLRALYRPDVFECTIGPRTGIMVVAALCEHQRSEVADIKRSVHDTLAQGIRRAAAIGGELPGEKLLALLRADQWDALLQLGEDDSKYHRLPRGRRPRAQQPSRTLRFLDKTASELLTSSGVPRHPGEGSTAMAYDANVGQEKFSYDAAQHIRFRNAETPSKDLEVIVTLLEVAAMSLGAEPGATFTFEELIAEARDVGGPEVELDERDVRIVLQKASFLEKVGGSFRLK